MFNSSYQASSSTQVNNENDISLDFRGNPADKTKTGGWLAAALILGTELAQRIIVIGISMNLVTYLRGEMHLNPSKSANIVTNFIGALNMLALFGGLLADAKLGRYLAILIFSTICAFGVILLAVVTTVGSMKPPHCEDPRGDNCIKANSIQLALLYVALYTVAVGGGGIKSNVSGFGSDQFDKSDPKEEKAVVFFFKRLYFFVSLGSLFAVTIMVYVQEKNGTLLGYGIPGGIMTFTLILLICGKRFYRYKKPQGSPLTIIWRVLFKAWRNRRLSYPDHPSLLNGYSSSKVPHSDNFRCLDKASIVGDWKASTVSEVEEVKMLIKLIPIWSAGILFWTVYSQIPTFTAQQAKLMNRKLGHFDIPAGSFSFFLFITILLLTCLIERVIVPIARKKTRHPKGLTSLQRIGIGLVFSVAGMVVAAIFEKKRREMHQSRGVEMSAFWLVPQFFLVGAGDAFAYVGQLEFFIIEAPERMKSLSTGLFSTTLAMGYFVSSVLVSITNRATHDSWLKNLNQGKLNNYYLVLAILGVFNFLAFLIMASRYQYKVESRTSNELGERETGYLEGLMV